MHPKPPNDFFRSPPGKQIGAKEGDLDGDGEEGGGGGGGGENVGYNTLPDDDGGGGGSRAGGMDEEQGEVRSLFLPSLLNTYLFQKFIPVRFYSFRSVATWPYTVTVQ